MPYIKIQTNATISEEKAASVSAALCEKIGVIPGKSEPQLMVGIEDGCKIYFRKSIEPAAVVKVDMYGESPAEPLSAFTGIATGVLHEQLGIAPDRIYVIYMSTKFWGWNGSNA